VINRLSSALTGTISPFEILFKQKPTYIMLHVLGCSFYPWLRPYNHHKLLPRSEKCAFLRYSTMHKRYYCLHLPSHRLYISRHVTFNETEFPFSIVSHPNTPADTSTLTSLLVLPLLIIFLCLQYLTFPL
jgi:hypothetical protein